jgi:hypothetical protein
MGFSRFFIMKVFAFLYAGSLFVACYCLADSSFQITPEGQRTDFSAGLAAPLPSKMYDESIASPDKHFVLIRGWKDKKSKDQLPPELAPRVQEEPKKGKEHLANFTPDERSPRDQVIARFGDPSKPPVVIPDEKAPSPFKGLHAALEVGDEELAFRYARQHVRYNAKFKDRVNSVVGLTAKALEAEGIADGEGWTSSGEYSKYEKYLQAAVEEERQALKEKLEDPFIAVLPVDLQQLAQKLLFDAPVQEQQLDEFNRDKFSTYLRNVVIPASSGKVNLTLIVNPNGDKASLLMAREMKRLAASLVGQNQITFKLGHYGFAHHDQQRSFKIRAGLGMNVDFEEIQDDEKQLFIPALKIEIPERQEVHLINGFRRATFIEELVKLFSGKSML